MFSYMKSTFINEIDYSQSQHCDRVAKQHYSKSASRLNYGHSHMSFQFIIQNIFSKYLSVIVQ